MKTAKKIEHKARRIARLVMELRDDVIRAKDPNTSDCYRGYVMGTEPELVDRYIDFADRMNSLKS